MEIFKDKNYVNLIDLMSFKLEILYKESEAGRLHVALKHSNEIRDITRSVSNKNLSDEKKEYYFRIISRGLEEAKSLFEDAGFSQVDVYGLQDDISYINSL